MTIFEGGREGGRSRPFSNSKAGVKEVERQGCAFFLTPTKQDEYKNHQLLLFTQLHKEGEEFHDVRREEVSSNEHKQNEEDGETALEPGDPAEEEEGGTPGGVRDEKDGVVELFGSHGGGGKGVPRVGKAGS